ncbi:MAG TPA: SDR family oxidoreductase [Acidimicrobiales bacterium]|nr:SDR family oxidoreductase [Acidimicrobiales bacterium]
MSAQRVVVVTGGGGGIGAAIAAELGRVGAFVVTLDPLVSLDGSEKLKEPQETTADRIVAAGGSARASSASVTDAEAVRALFADLLAEFGRLDAVVNVAGISRPTGFAKGTEDDWRAVLAVHFDGYCNVLAAALPLMAEAGSGRILGVTSGSGWRAADTGAYGCAKRAVASLTWQLGKHAPAGVVVNALSPIAVTRMVTAALGKAPSGTSAATGGLNLGSMPEPADIGPLGAHLVGEGFGWCSGEVIFAGGSEAAVVDPPRLLEVVRADMLAVAGAALVAAEASQLSGGGSNPRFTADGADGADESASPVRTCALVSDRPELSEGIAAALKVRGVACEPIASSDQIGDAEALVVALAGRPPAPDAADWERVLAEHTGIVEDVFADSMWARAVADLRRPIRMLTVTDARTAGGRSRAQSSAQLARSARTATRENVSAFAVSDEAGDTATLAELSAYLLGHAEGAALSGAELAAGAGWVGVRSHPRPGASFVLGDSAVPGWFDDTLRSVLR